MTPSSMSMKCGNTIDAVTGLILNVQSNQFVQSKMQFVQSKMRNCAVKKHKVEDIIDIK